MLFQYERIVAADDPKLMMSFMPPLQKMMFGAKGARSVVKFAEIVATVVPPTAWLPPCGTLNRLPPRTLAQSWIHVIVLYQLTGVGLIVAKAWAILSPAETRVALSGAH